MRERVAVVGGVLESGARPGGGFVVRARLPRSDGGVSIRVLIADDQELVRTGFRMILTGEPDITVVGEAGDGSPPSSSRAVSTSTWCDGHPHARDRRDRGDAATRCRVRARSSS